MRLQAYYNDYIHVIKTPQIYFKVTINVYLQEKNSQKYTIFIRWELYYYAMIKMIVACTSR